MRTIHVHYPIACSARRFWENYFDESSTRRLFLEGLRWSDPVISEFRESEAEIIRNMGAKPALEVGGRVAKLIGDRLGYKEEGRFDRTRQQFHFRHRTNIFGDKLHMGGRMWAEDDGDQKCRWHTQVEIEARIFGLAPLLEKAVEINVHRFWPVTAEFFDRLARRQGHRAAV